MSALFSNFLLSFSLTEYFIAQIGDFTMCLHFQLFMSTPLFLSLLFFVLLFTNTLMIIQHKDFPSADHDLLIKMSFKSHKNISTNVCTVSVLNMTNSNFNWEQSCFFCLPLLFFNFQKP